MVCFLPEPINPEHAFSMLGKNSAGSALFHFATAKAINGPKGTTAHINYESNGNAVSELEAISAEMKEKWNLSDVLLLRRKGKLEIGEIISLVAVSSSRSEAAFAACQFGLDRMKTMSSIIKTEVLV